MGEPEERCSPGRSFSLMCLEDGTDLDGGGGFAESAVEDAQLLLLCGDAGVVEEEDEKEEYMGHLGAKESSFACGSPSASSPAAFSSDDLSDDAAEASPSCEASSSEEDWFCCARRATVKWIVETRACFGFSHRTAYLAVSYLDRFCLRRRFHRSAMPWAARLQAVACVSLAAKMEEERAPPLSAFRADDGYDFSSANIRKMELLVLSTLGWRMGDVTPLDYLPCLASRLRHRRDDASGGGGALVAAKAAALIFSAAEAVSLLDYRPSTVAVAAVLAATQTQAAGAATKEALESEMSGLSPSWLLDKEDVHACYRLMLSESSSAATPSNKRPPASPRPSSGPMDVDAAEAAAGGSKRARLELPATGL